MPQSPSNWLRRVRRSFNNRLSNQELRQRLRKTCKLAMEQLETRAVMATVSLGDVVPLAEGFGFGSTIAGLGRAFDATTPDQFTLISFKNNGSAIADAGRFTVEAWVYPKPGQSKGVIWTMGGTYGLSLVNETGLQFQMGRAAVFERNDVNINLTIPKVLNPDAWNHVAVTYDGDRARIYVNGVDVGSSTPFNPDPTPLKLYGILSSSVSSTVNLDIPSVSAGAIDELRIWTTVRTPAEIQETMLTPLAGTEPGLIGYWNFDNPSPDSPDRELDSSPSGNSLFMTKPKYILNASPQVGYVDVVVSEPVTDVKGLWVAYDVVSGSATEEVDFSGAAFRKVSDQPTTERNGIIIPKGATRGRVYFVARPDAISESTESFDVKLANYSFSGASASDYVIAAPSQKTVSIVDSGAYQKNVGLVDSFGRAVTAATKLFVDPVTRNATFSVQLTSEPDFAAPQEDVVFLELSATNAAVDDGRGAAQSLTLRFTPANWDVPRTFTLTGVTADGTISLNDRTSPKKYLSADASFPFTLTLPNEARPRENNPFDASPVKPKVSFLKGANVLEGDDVPGNFVVQLDAPAPRGGLDVFYSVQSTARESIDFQRLPGVVHIDEGLRETKVPVFAIDNLIANPPRNITISLNTSSSNYLAGSTTSVVVSLIDDEKARIVAVNPVTVDVVQEKDIRRTPTVGEEITQPFSLNDDTKTPLGTVGTYDAPTWTYTGGLGSSFTAGQFDADRIEFSLGAKADADAKIRVRFQPTGETGLPTVRLVKSGADGVNSINLGDLLNVTSGNGTRLTGGSLTSPKLPTVVADDTLEWSLADLPAGTYRLILSTTSNLSNFLANPDTTSGAAFRYDAKFTSNPKAPYSVFTTATVSSFADNYSTLVTAEPVPTAPTAAEPNNTTATAYNLGTAYDEQLITSQTIDAGGDIDIYRFKLSQSAGRPDTLVAEFARPTGSVNPLLLDILNADGTVRIAEAVRAQNQYVTLTSLPDGEYFARVRAANATVPKTDYSLRFRTLVNPSEHDANNTVAQATYLGTALPGDRFNDMAIVSSSDVDFYRFTLDAKAGRPDKINVISKNTAGLLFVQLVNATTGAAIQQFNNATDIKTVSLASLADGDYGLRVEAENTGLQNKYDIAFGSFVARQAETSPNRIAFRLDTQPTANVTVTFTSQNTTQGTVEPSTLTFTPANWDTYQLLTVTPHDDGLFAGDVNYNITGKATSTDPSYQSLVVTVPVTNVDRGNFVQPADEPVKGDEGTPVVTITALQTSVNEGNSVTAFRVTLDKPFTQDTTILVDFTRGTAVEGVNFKLTQGTASEFPVKFFAGETKRDISITTVRDQVQRSTNSDPLVLRAAIVDGDGFRPSEKADPGYTAAINLQEVDFAGVNVTSKGSPLSTQTPSVLFEPETLARMYSVSLTSKPKADVTVPIAVSDVTEALVSLDTTKPGAGQVTLSFTADNWNTPQNFYIVPMQDKIADNSVYTHFTVGAEGNDEVYRALKAQTFGLMTLDDDSAGIVVTSPQTTVSGRANVFSVTLSTQPIGEVRVTMMPRNDQISLNGERAGEPSTLVFNSLNWNIPQLNQVVANDDKLVENFHTSQIDFRVDSGRKIADAPSVDNSTSATAISLGDITGGVRIENMELPYAPSFPFLGDEWYRFKISASLSEASKLRLSTYGSNQIYLPNVEIYDASSMQLLSQNKPTQAGRTPDGGVTSPAFLSKALKDLEAGEYIVRIYTTASRPTAMTFSLWFDDGDRTYDSVAIPSMPISIKDDDLPIAELLAGPMASEVSSEPSYFAVRLNAPAPAGPADTGVVVKFKVTGGSATNGTKTTLLHDYSVIADRFDPTTGEGSVRVAPGDIQANIGILPIDDKLVEDVPLKLKNYNATTGKVRITGVASTLSPTSASSTYNLLKDSTIVTRTADNRELTFTVSADTPLNRVGAGDSSTYEGDVSVTLAAKDAQDAPALTQTELRARVKSETVQITLLTGTGYTLPLAPDKQDLSPTVAANLDANRIKANLTIFDDDVPGVEIIEIGEHTTLAEGDEATFQVSLTSEPSQNVDIELIPGKGISLVTPATTASKSITPTRYRMTTTGLPDNVDLTFLSVDATDLGFVASFDARLTRPKLLPSVAQNLSLTITNTNGAQTGSSASTLFEIPSADAVYFAGEPDQGLWKGTRRLTVTNMTQLANGQFTFNVSYGTESGTITLAPEASSPLTVSTSKLTFAKANWFVPQTVVIKAPIDSFAQPGAWHKAVINYQVTSTSPIWDGTPVPAQEIHVRDAQMNVGDTVEGIGGAFGALTMGLQGLDLPLLGAVGDLPIVSSMFSKVESPLTKSLGAHESLSVEQFEEIAESSLDPLVANDTVDEVTVVPSSDADEVRVALHIGKTFNIGSFNLDSDLGLEALGITFATQGIASLDVDFQFDVTIGWNHQFGFFIDTAHTGIHMGAKLSLQGPTSAPTTPFTGKGTLGFLQLDFTNDPDNPTELSLTFDATLNDLDNLNTTQFFDLNGDGVLADSPLIYDVGVDNSPKDGRIDLSTTGQPVTTKTTIAAVEPFATIDARGVANPFPSVDAISKAGGDVAGAKAANWNTIGSKTNTFDEAEVTLNEGQYLREIRGTTTIVYLDANRNGKLDIGARNIDPFTKTWNSLTLTQKAASEVWTTTTTSTGVIPEFRILTTGSGATLKSFVDVNRDNRAGTDEQITAKLLKKLDKDNSKVLEGDVRQDGEGSYVQGTSTAFFDANRNGKQDFNEPFISYSFDDFTLDLAVAIEDSQNVQFLDYDGDGQLDTNEPRVLIVDLGDSAVLDLNGNNQADPDEPKTARASESFLIPQTKVSANSDVTFNNAKTSVLTIDGTRFIDFDKNGELTLNADGEPVEPWAEQRADLSNADMNRLVKRIHTLDANIFASQRAAADKLKNNETLNETEQSAIKTAFNKLVAESKIVLQPSDGDRLTLSELAAFRTSLQASAPTRGERVKAAASELFTFEFQGGANIGFKTKTSVGGSSNLPSIEFDLAVSLPLFNFGNADQADDNGFSVDFNNVTLDLGSFLQRFVEPILATANDVLGPIKPIVTALNADTKLLSKLGLASTFESDGRPGVSLLEIARKIRSGNPAEVAKIDKAIKFSKQIASLVDTIDTLSEQLSGDSTKLSFGNFSLDDLRAASDAPSSSAAQVRKAKRADGTPAVSTELPRTTAADIESQATKSSSLKNRFDSLRKVEGLKINLFDPNTVMSLIMGEPNVNLVTYDVPDFAFDFKVGQEFRIWGPIKGKLEGGFNVATDLSVGYDTAGLQAWADADFDPLKSYLVLDGIYVDDWNAAGVEKDELTVSAFISAGVGLDIGIAKGFVKGGVEGIVGFDIIDEGERSGDSDGKIRGSDIIHKMANNPADLFDLSGKVNAFLAAEVKVNMLFFKKTVYNNRLATFELAKFKLSPGAGSGSSLAGKVQTGPIADGVVWFDANDNLMRDDGEPFAITDFEGNYELTIPDDFDLSTGTIRVEGGRDMSTGLPSHDDVAIPRGGHGNVTALTALEEALNADVGMSTAESQMLIEEAFGIDPSVDLSTFAHHDEALAGNPLAGPVLLAENNVNSLVQELDAALSGAAGVAQDDHHYTGVFSEAAFVALARHLNRHDLDLANPLQLKQILLEAATIANERLVDLGDSAQVNVDRLVAHQDAIATVLAATIVNQRTLAAQATNVVDLAHRVTQEKLVANGKVAADLYLLVQGLLSDSQIVDDDGHTDATALNAIKHVKLPPLVSAVHDVQGTEDVAIPPVPLVVRRQMSEPGEVVIEVSTDNDTLLPSSAVRVVRTGHDALADHFEIQILPTTYKFGTAHVTLHVSDTAGSSIDETFVVNVAWADHAPVAQDDVVSAVAGRAATARPLDNDRDNDGDTLHVGLVSVPVDGVAVVQNDGTITYTPPATATGSRTLVYEVDDGNGGYSTASIVFQLIDPAADLAMTQTASPVAMTGHEVVFALTVSNTGPHAASNVVVTDTLPAGTTFVSALAAPGFTIQSPANGGTGSVTFHGGSIANGASVNFVVVGRVATSAASGSQLTNSASVTTTAFDIDSTNNQSTGKSLVNGSGVFLAPSATDLGRTDLVVTGNGAANMIIVLSASGGKLSVLLDSKLVNNLNPTGRIVVYGGAGNDTIRIDPTITRSAILFGDAGFDYLYGGGGPTVLVGGEGNDWLFAGQSRNLLLGGTGADRLDGSQGDNLLMGGVTDYDANEVALSSLLAEWSATSVSYELRTSHLTAGGGLNGSYALSVDRIHDDDAVDSINGGLGQNWYFTRETTGLRRDQVTRRKSTERTVRL